MFSFTTIASYHQQLLSGEITCVQAVDYYLQQIKDLERLNAFIEVFSKEAVEKAIQADASQKAGAVF